MSRLSTYEDNARQWKRAKIIRRMESTAKVAFNERMVELLKNDRELEPDERARYIARYESLIASYVKRQLKRGAP